MLLGTAGTRQLLTPTTAHTDTRPEVEKQVAKIERQVFHSILTKKDNKQGGCRNTKLRTTPSLRRKGQQ
ncbi:hypothetical protein D8676_01690 [Mesorhizobium sp. YM1C-6-2]|nr:hypothetical protein D8676_01690 [Mesorhizobium sp. YM1C-6-2]